MFSECENLGQSERCNLEDCHIFWDGDCKDPGMVVEYEMEYDKAFIDWEEIYELYPDLIGLWDEVNKPNKEKIMDKNQAKLDVQRVDREGATKKVETFIKELSTNKVEVFYDGETTEIFNETIHVPVRVSCIERDGARKVYVNAFGANDTSIGVVLSKELIECLQTLRTKVDGIDAELGCENLDKEASGLL